MACTVIDIFTRQRRDLPAAPPNPFAPALAAIAGLNAILYGAHARAWADLAAAMRGSREDVGAAPCDSEPDGAA